MSEKKYLSGIKVVYGNKESEAPSNRIREDNKKSDNINDGFGGKFVWLVPEYAPVKDLAVTGFDIVIQKECDPSRDNLAEGTRGDYRGDYRYLILVKNIMQQEKVADIALLRLNDGTVGDSPVSDWKYSSNINQGRGGSSLRLMWRTSSA